MEDNTSNSRGFDKIDQLLTRAKLDKNDMLPLVQNICFGSDIASDELKLMEVDKNMLEYLLEGNSLVIRGNPTENAVCCSENATYMFKVAEISNPLLLAPNLEFPTEIDNSTERSTKKTDVELMTNCYFALNKEKPKLQKLKNLLEMNLYMGKSMEQQNTDVHRYTISDLLSIIQASEEEIYSYLNHIEAFKIDGYWRLLDFGFYNQIIDNILKLIDEKSFSFNKVPMNDIYQELQQLYNLSLLRQVVDYYFEQNQDESNIYEIKKEKIYRFYAESLLRSTLKMNFSEFTSILKRSLPTPFYNEFNVKYIQNICYVEEPYIYYLNALELPDEIEKRFKVLFDKRKKWPSDELTAFILDICSNDLTETNNALAKYCRPFTQNGQKFFSSRL